MSNHERSHEAKYEAKDLSKDKKKGKKALIAAVATGVLVLGVGGALISGHLNRSSPEANNNPTTSQQTNETETTPSGPQIPEKAESYGGIEQGLEGEELTKAFEIQAGLSNEEYAQAFVNRLNAWTMYGSTPELAKQFWKEGGRAESAAIIDKISKSNTASIRAGLFSDIAEDKPGNSSRTYLENFISYMTDVNKFSLGVWARTIPYPEVNPENKEAYTRTSVIESVVDESKYAPNNRTRLIVVTVTQKENIDKNNSEELNAGSLGTEGRTAVYTITTVTENGIEKVSGIGRK